VSFVNRFHSTYRCICRIRESATLRVLTGCRRQACRFRWCFFSLTVVLQNIRPLSTLTCMTVFEMLSKMIRPIELFCCIAFSEFVDVGQMLNPFFPVWRLTGKFFTTVPARIRSQVPRIWECRGVEGGLICRDCCTRPGLLAKMK